MGGLEFGEVLARRRMVRAYTGEPVDPAALDRVVDAAGRAPSAGFSQGFATVVVTAPDRRRALAAVCGEEAAVARGLPRWISTAPVLLVPCVRPADYHQRYGATDKAAARPPSERPVPWWWVDAGQALVLLLLAAVDEGLAAGLLDVGDHAGLRALLDIPADVEPLGVVTVGHAAPDRPSGSLRRGRRPRWAVVRREHW